MFPGLTSGSSFPGFVYCLGWQWRKCFPKSKGQVEVGQYRQHPNDDLKGNWSLLCTPQCGSCTWCRTCMLPVNVLRNTLLSRFPRSFRSPWCWWPWLWLHTIWFILRYRLKMGPNSKGFGSMIARQVMALVALSIGLSSRPGESRFCGNPLAYKEAEL
jgi:hypothetical protein